MPANNPSSGESNRNGNGTTDQGEPIDSLTEAEALRGQLQEAIARTSRLIAVLKHQKRQSRAVQAAMASLRKLQPDL